MQKQGRQKTAEKEQSRSDADWCAEFLVGLGILNCFLMLGFGQARFSATDQSMKKKRGNQRKEQGKKRKEAE